MNLIPPSKVEEDIVENLKSSLKYVETFIAFGSLLTLLVCEFEYELAYYPNMYNCNGCNYRGLPVRIIVSAACALLAILSIYAALLAYQIKREQRKLITGKNKNNIVSFWRSNYFLSMLIDILICLIHPIPAAEYKFTLTLLGQQISYQLMTFFYALMFLKLYLVVRIAAVYTSYSSKMSEKICGMYGTEANTTFQLKAIQKDHPFYIVSMSFADSTSINWAMLTILAGIWYQQVEGSSR